MLLGNALYGLKYLFAQATRSEPGTKDSVDKFVLDLLDQSNGIGIGEYHGMYNYPLFIAEHAKSFAEHGVTDFFAEPVPRKLQHLLNQWQYYDNPKPLINFLNRRTHANSSYQFEHYWIMFQALKKARICVHGISRVFEEHEEFSMEVANASFLDAIKHGRAHRSAEEKYIVFAGQGHFRYSCDGQKGISYALGIPAIQLESGPYAIVRNAVSPSEHIVRIPLSSNHIACFRGPVVKHREISYPGEV